MDRDIKVRAAVVVTLLAGLELAREGSLTIEQKANFALVRLTVTVRTKNDAPVENSVPFELSIRLSM